jgi:hypothetical protein
VCHWYFKLDLYVYAASRLMHASFHTFRCCDYRIETRDVVRSAVSLLLIRAFTANIMQIFMPHEYFFIDGWKDSLLNITRIINIHHRLHSARSPKYRNTPVFSSCKVLEDWWCILTSYFCVLFKGAEMFIWQLDYLEIRFCHIY